ncbi:MAG TPA: hypothetical protein VE650_03060 [Acetobacteraceae bacterium]|nr:hypothetical protein [Acetobacteraceae bacterium]
MADPKSEVAPSYGEGDIEAKSMTDATQGKRKPVSDAKVPPPDAIIPNAGTTETDIARNLGQKAERETKS